MPERTRPHREPREWPPPQGWLGWDEACTCNLCHIWAPWTGGDERLLEIEDVGRFIWIASLYRTPEQGRALLRRWVERHGGDFEELLLLAHL